MLNRSDNRSCLSAVLVILRKEQQPLAMVRCYYALYFVLLTHEADLVVAGGQHLCYNNNKILVFLLGFPVGTGRYYVLVICTLTREADIA